MIYEPRIYMECLPNYLGLKIVGSISPSVSNYIYDIEKNINWQSCSMQKIF